MRTGLIATGVAAVVAVAATVVLTAPPASAAVELPPAHGRFDYQLGGAYAPRSWVDIVDRDRTDSPVAGRYNICYVNGFQTQPGEASWWRAHYAHLLLKDAKNRYVTDPGWPDEILFDTSTADRRDSLTKIVGRWIDGCAADGFQAIEPDNLDSWTRSGGRLTRTENVWFALRLAQRAHAAGLAIGQKNTSELGTTGRDRVGFDFAITEECQVYDECGAYTRVYGDQVYEVEYTDNGRSAFTAACSDHGDEISVIYRDRDVAPRGRAGYTYAVCT